MPNTDGFKISVSDGEFDITWRLNTSDAGVSTVTQVDKLGDYPLDFRTEHDAIQWALSQAIYAVQEMGFKYAANKA